MDSEPISHTRAAEDEITSEEGKFIVTVYWDEWELKREHFKNLALFQYAHLWCQVIMACMLEENVIQDGEDEYVIRYLSGASCVASINHHGHRVLDFSWDSSTRAPTCFASGRQIVLSRTAPDIDGCMKSTMKIHEIGSGRIRVLEPSRVPDDLEQNQWRLDVVQDVKQQHRFLDNLRSFCSTHCLSTDLQELISYEPVDASAITSLNERSQANVEQIVTDAIVRFELNTSQALAMR
eukprot:5978959-Karenia_brevis.AAC.1